MAIDNADLERAFDELRQATGSTQNAFNAMSAAANNATNAQSKFANAALGAASSLTRGFTAFAGATSSGEASLKNFNSVIDGTVGAISKLSGVFGAAGKALGGFAEGVGEAAKFLVIQVDRTAKSFNILSQVGAVGAKGMSQFYDATRLQGERLQTGGLSLEQFSKVVMDNSQVLQQFGGTTYDGVNRFSDALQNFTTGNDDTLRKLGMSAEQMGQFQANYIKQQTLLGRGQNMTTQELINGTKQYAMELDKLQKLTGLSREALDKEKEMRMAQSGYLALQRKMEREGQGEQFAKIDQVVQQVSKNSKEYGAGLMTLLRTNGAAIDENSQKLVLATGGAAATLVRDLRAGTISQTEFAQRMTEAMGKTEESIENYRLMTKDAGDETYGMLTGSVKLQADEGFKNADVQRQAAQTTKDQINKTDDLTMSTINAQKGMEKLGRTVDELGFKFANQTAAAVDAMTNAIQKLVGWVDGILPAGGFGGGGGRSAVPEVSTEEKARLANIEEKRAAERKAQEEYIDASRKWAAARTAEEKKAAEVELENAKKRHEDAVAARELAQKTAAVVGGGGGGGPTGPADVEKILATIRGRESSGNYSAKNAGSSASGAYQFIDSTWREQSRKAGIGTEYKSAKDAPKEVQDAVARAYVQDILKQAGGDVSKVPLAWYTGNIQGNISPADLAANKGLRPEQYQSAWMKSYAGTSGPRETYVPTAPSTPEAPLPMTGTTPASAASNAQAQNELLAAQLDRLDQLVTSMRTQVGNTEKLIRMQS